ncbi:MAG TPA: hypothetical protein DCL06_03315 [Corynebacterium variabile]|uniref:Uncharacterized protein n=1 Tax=Corynebacterium variabile TaxID=1727 RepID=A0A3B9QTT3_9CORY|nr:hypothetical protein [Corynebacterium variabile]
MAEIVCDSVLCTDVERPPCDPLGQTVRDHLGRPFGHGALAHQLLCLDPVQHGTSLICTFATTALQRLAQQNRFRQLLAKLFLLGELVELPAQFGGAVRRIGGDLAIPGVGGGLDSAVQSVVGQMSVQALAPGLLTGIGGLLGQDVTVKPLVVV